MKNSTVFALALCGALAFALTGCKYDDTEALDPNATQVGDAASQVDDLANAGKDVNSAADDEAARRAAEEEAARRAAAEAAAAAAALKDADASSLADATTTPFDQDPNFARCTDVDFVPVYFGFDADMLAQSEMAKVELVAKHLVEKPNRVVIIEGNCDERGSNEYNLALGEQRAIKIHDYLIRLGIEEKRIQTKSYGEEKPAVQGSSEAAWSKNRRGEFAVFQHK